MNNPVENTCFFCEGSLKNIKNPGNGFHERFFRISYV